MREYRRFLWVSLSENIWKITKFNKKLETLKIRKKLFKNANASKLKKSQKENFKIRHEMTQN